MYTIVLLARVYIYKCVCVYLCVYNVSDTEKSMYNVSDNGKCDTRAALITTSPGVVKNIHVCMYITLEIMCPVSAELITTSPEVSGLAILAPREFTTEDLGYRVRVDAIGRFKFKFRFEQTELKRR